MRTPQGWHSSGGTSASQGTPQPGSCRAYVTLYSKPWGWNTPTVWGHPLHGAVVGSSFGRADVVQFQSRAQQGPMVWPGVLAAPSQPRFSGLGSMGCAYAGGERHAAVLSSTEPPFSRCPGLTGDTGHEGVSARGRSLSITAEHSTPWTSLAASDSLSFSALAVRKLRAELTSRHQQLRGFYVMPRPPGLLRAFPLPQFPPPFTSVLLHRGHYSKLRRSVC